MLVECYLNTRDVKYKQAGIWKREREREREKERGITVMFSFERLSLIKMPAMVNMVKYWICLEATTENGNVFPHS